METVPQKKILKRQTVIQVIQILKFHYMNLKHYKLLLNSHQIKKNVKNVKKNTQNKHLRNMMVNIVEDVIKNYNYT